MLNYYTSILFTYVQNVNQTRNRITQYIFNTYPLPYLPVSVPATRPFRNLGPVSPLCRGGWCVGVGGILGWPRRPRCSPLPLRRGLGLRDWHTCPPAPPTPGSRPAPPRPHMCPGHVSRQGTNNFGQ